MKSVVAQSTQTSKKTIIITGGGTGGHLFPALAVAEALRQQRPDVDLLYISREHERDRGEVERRKIDFLGFPLEGLRRKITLSNVRALWKFVKAVLKCWVIMKRKPAGVVFGVGGYVSAPAMTAGKLAGWKVTLHEQNTIPGLVNRMLASRCDRVFVTYESSQSHFRGVTCMLTGLPIRSALLDASKQDTPRSSHQTPFVLVIGGSQGARSVVETSLKAFQHMEERGIAYRALIQTGEKNFEWASALPRPEGVALKPFIDDMASAYTQADIIISRAGSGSLSEIALWGLPSILIPYPYASENHQKMNAQTFAEAGAAFVLEEKNLSPEILANPLATLLTDPVVREALSIGAANIAHRDASHVIAKELLQLLDA